MKTVLGTYYVHAGNSGWQLEIVQEDGFARIEASFDEHCDISGKESREGLTSKDLQNIGSMFIDAAKKLDKQE